MESGSANTEDGEVTACPSCGQRNRLARGDGSARFRCGACKAEIQRPNLYTDDAYTVIRSVGAPVNGTQEQVLRLFADGKLQGSDMIAIAGDYGNGQWVTLNQWVIRYGLVLPPRHQPLTLGDLKNKILAIVEYFVGLFLGSQLKINLIGLALAGGLVTFATPWSVTRGPSEEYRYTTVEFRPLWADLRAIDGKTPLLVSARFYTQIAVVEIALAGCVWAALTAVRKARANRKKDALN